MTHGDMLRRIGRLMAEGDNHRLAVYIDQLAREGGFGDDFVHPWCDNLGPCATDEHCDDFSCRDCIEKFLGQEAKTGGCL
ncbi:MAG: hypothetical protein IJA75_03205 [Oscillospiraceae bacterium]|nr:hypothetical protein [Oscillospiraceae bacterium]